MATPSFELEPMALATPEAVSQNAERVFGALSEDWGNPDARQKGMAALQSGIAKLKELKDSGDSAATAALRDVYARLDRLIGEKRAIRKAFAPDGRSDAISPLLERRAEAGAAAPRSLLDPRKYGRAVTRTFDKAGHLTERAGGRFKEFVNGVMDTVGGAYKGVERGVLLVGKNAILPVGVAAAAYYTGAWDHLIRPGLKAGLQSAAESI